MIDLDNNGTVYYGFIQTRLAVYSGRGEYINRLASRPLTIMLLKVTEIANIMSRVQQRLADVSRRSEEHGDVWQARVIELESQNKEYLDRANWLHQQNAQLENKASQWQPEMDNAIDARDAAFRKLRNTRRLVRDLIEERVNYSVLLFVVCQHF